MAVTALEIHTRSVVLAGRAFGKAGVYEKIAGVLRFTGWNPRHPSQGAAGDLMSMMGSTFPFARTRAERDRTGDPCPSIEERYATRDAYVRSVRRAAAALVAARHLLAEDVEAVVERAGRQWDLFHAGLAG